MLFIADERRVLCNLVDRGMIQIKITVAIIIALCAISCASLLIKLTDAPPLTIAFYRVLIGACIYAPVAVINREIGAISRYHAGCMFAGGICLAAHFGFWILSLSYTSVASSVSLVNTSPIFVVILSRFFGRLSAERSRRPKFLWSGVILGLIGSAGLAGSDLMNPQAHSAVGDLMATAGAISLAGYLLAGRAVGTAVPLALYLTCVYGIAAAVLLISCLLSSSTLAHFPMDTLLMLLLIGVIPQGIGHSLLNWTLRYLPASLVSLFVIAEPVGATVLAAIFLGEYPSIMNVLFMVIIITGILISQRAYR